MEKIGKTSILKFVQTAYKLAQRTVPEYSSKFSKKTFTLQQHAVIICLKIREDKNYREIVEMLVEMPRIRRAIDLDEIPHFTTLCKAFDRLQTKLWRSLLEDTSQLLELNGIVTIDSSGEERSRASRHYTKRINLHIQELKVTLLVDTAENAIIDAHITTTRKHDTQIAPKLIKRCFELICTLLGDKGYDDQKIRELARNLGIRTLIKHREFTNLHKAWNARMDSDLYNQRNQSESVNSSIGRNYGSHIRSRVWYRQFREVIIKCSVHNIDRSIKN
ncbi:transposase [candidate division MSBL1 archaeon SCGC-AAA382A20]|uniref:Transposase n=1 Tax=candidate division MSBL1 archaeon SCGC-AAA382A20 TaxID=1698280 RepID=A0A133VI05_9EURY|nr:transposase [candidate division MSBL1 archaeon SCGC-AAA382A20]